MLVERGGLAARCVLCVLVLQGVVPGTSRCGGEVPEGDLGGDLERLVVSGLRLHLCLSDQGLLMTQSDLASEKLWRFFFLFNFGHMY